RAHPDRQPAPDRLQAAGHRGGAPPEPGPARSRGRPADRRAAPIAARHGRREGPAQRLRLQGKAGDRGRPRLGGHSFDAAAPGRRLRGLGARLRDPGEDRDRTGGAGLYAGRRLRERGRGRHHEQPSGLPHRGDPRARAEHAEPVRALRQLEPVRSGRLPRSAGSSVRGAGTTVRRVMKILFLCHRLPYPPKRGGKIRPFNMIRHLSRRHEVTVATVARSAAELAEGQDLRRYCHELHVERIPAYAAWSRFGLYTATTYPATFGYFYSPALDRTVQTLLATRGFEAIFLHCSSMGPYVARHRGCRKILDYGDADSEKWLEYARATKFPISVGFELEGRKVRRYEQWLAEG